MSKGRPTIKTPELLEQLLAAIVQLGSIAEACEAVGLNRKTLWTWQNSSPMLSASILSAQRTYLLRKEPKP